MSWFKQQRNRIIVMGIMHVIPFFALAQQHNLSLNQTFHADFERSVLQSSEIIHHSFQPVLQREALKAESSLDTISPALFFPRKRDKSFVARKLFHEHFISLDTGIFQLTIDPLVNLERSNDSKDPRDISLFKNTRGFVLRASLGNKIAIASTFRENQANLPFYLSQQTQATGVVYGQGRTKQFKTDGFDFAMASSYVSYSPSDRINLQIGQGKHFIGNGHRSLLLSDVAFNYPFLKINTNWLENKVQYQNIFALLQDLNRLNTVDAAEGLFERKQGAFHYLEYSPNAKLSVALFEGVIFPSLDTTGNLDVGMNYWIPLIFLNSLIEGGDLQGNTNIGINTSYQLANKVLLYQQLAIYDEQLKNYNLQLGAKWFPHINWMAQGEFNSIAQMPNGNLYHHYNESLTHPLNREASELIGILQFKKNRWLSRGQANLILADTYDLQFMDFRQSFIVNPSYNLTIHIGYQLRSYQLNENNVIQLSTVSSPNSNILYLGVSTNLQNMYFNY